MIPTSKGFQTLALEEGFSMLEVLVSLVIFGVFSVSVLSTSRSFIAHITYTNVKSEAAAVAVRVFDQLREVSPDSLPSGGTMGPEVISGGKYSFEVYTSYCLNSAMCPSTRTRHITVDVKYRGTTVYSVENVYTRLR